MNNEKANAIAQTVELILQVDDGRATRSPFKLPAGLRAEASDRLASYRNVAQLLTTASGQRSGNAEKVKESLPRLAGHLRDGFKFLDALPTFRVSESDKRSAFAAYGWDANAMGKLVKKERVLELARLALSVTPSIQPDVARYPVDLLEHIEVELSILDAANTGARVGNRSSITRERDRALHLLARIVSRVRAFYISASDDLDETPELAKIGLNPTRRSGQRRVPGEPAPATDPAV